MNTSCAAPNMDPEPFLVITSGAAGRSVSLPARWIGHRVANLGVCGQPRRATVIYAPDLGRARTISRRIPPGESEMVLLDLHVSLSATNATLGQRIGSLERSEPLKNRLKYVGTYDGLGSYLSDLARMSFTDGVILSVVPDCGKDIRGVIAESIPRLCRDLGSRRAVTLS